MWKWIGIILLIIVAGVAALVLWGVSKARTFAEQNSGPVTYVIDAPPARVFASLANADSIGTWMSLDSTRPIAHHGLLVVGDSLPVAATRTTTDTNRTPMHWVVSEVTPGTALVIDQGIATPQRSMVMLRRRFELQPAGAGTTVVATATSPMNDTKGSQPGMMAGFATDMMAAGAHMQADMELKRLKARIEGAASSAAKQQ